MAIGVADTTSAEHMARIRTLGRGAKRRIPSASTVLNVIRRYCWECVGGSWPEVEACVCRSCLLYPYRMGRLGFLHPERYDLDGGQGYIEKPANDTEAPTTG